MSSEVETSRWRHGTVFYGIPRLCFAPLGMTFQLSSSEKSARSREKFGPMHTPVAGELMATGAQDYLAVPNFAIRYSILVGIFDHVIS
jgi:hypothetical protein